MSQPDIIDALVRNGNPWLTALDISIATGKKNNTYVHLSRLADMLQTRPDPENHRRNQYRLHPRHYVELCAAHDMRPAEEGTRPYSLSAHMRNHAFGSSIGAGGIYQ